MDLITPAQCLTFNLQRAARAMARRMDAAFSPLGLTAQQFSALAILSVQEPLSTTKLAERIGAERTTVTRNMGLLRKRGLVEPAEDEDGRVSAYRLTDQGRETLQQALPLWREVQGRAIARLDGADGPSAASVLAALRHI